MSVITNFLYYVVLPYALALAMVRLSDRARFAHVDRSDIRDGYLREPPSTDEPMFLARVMDEDFVLSGVTATLLALERKGVVRIERVPTAWRCLRIDDRMDEARAAKALAQRAASLERETVRVSLAADVRPERLTAYERMALEQVFVDGRTSITAEELAEARLEVPAYLARQGRRLSDMATRDMQGRHLVEGVSPSLFWLAVVLLVAYVLGAFLLVGFDVLPMIFFGLPGLAMMVAYSRPREVYTAEGRTLLVRCHAFQRYLVELTRTRDARLTDVALWGEQLVYGVAVNAVGAAPRELFPKVESGRAPAAPDWYVAYARAHDEKNASSRPLPPS
ncbi:MAG TPA: DUF2207 domain-containing protein [Candidatus Olsenella pullistercoris]|uniref:DUF2207 domain-containing protein n=1 Tax=Candidatus Olsenella pullistercoris TaxID=2838712 RepID=A0A9D2F0C5_9ACTN|nr:DUF2207 domain-containing protein [Candidatus Olsenella pullistercoris]